MSLMSGFTTTVDLIEVTPEHSGFGTVALVETTVSSGVSARFTMLDGMQKDYPQGRGAEIVWKVVAHVDLIQDRLLEQTSTFKIKDTGSDIEYRVLKVKAQVDDIGTRHHVSLVVIQDQ